MQCTLETTFQTHVAFRLLPLNMLAINYYHKIFLDLGEGCAIGELTGRRGGMEKNTNRFLNKACYKNYHFFH